MCLNWLLSLWNSDPQAYAAADALADAEAAEEVSPGFRWTEEASRAVHPTVWTPESSATTTAPPAVGVRRATQNRPSGTATVPFCEGPRKGSGELSVSPETPLTVPGRQVSRSPGTVHNERPTSEMLYEAAGVISMLMPGNELVDELRELGARWRDIEDHIEEFGTTPPVGDGITDDTAALQAVLDRYYK